MSVKMKPIFTSSEWLEKYGLKAKGLGFYDYLLVYGLVLKHCDGKIIPQKSTKDANKTITVEQHQISAVGAKYCQCFAHIIWRDGKRIVHANISPVKAESYEKEMEKALLAIQKRIAWLKKSTLFGPIQENHICFLIDTSGSMSEHMGYIKEKISILVQNHLRHKKKFNLVAFDSDIKPWKEILQDITDENINDALKWVQNMDMGCSTNVLEGLQFCLTDQSAEAIYLLTDGAPNQDPELILRFVKSNCKIPIHTLSFACDDIIANKFLEQLSILTGGRYQMYTASEIPDSNNILYMSQDMMLLKEELKKGYQDLDKMKDLRKQCFELGPNNQRMAPSNQPKSIRSLTMTSLSSSTTKIPTNSLSFSENYNKESKKSQIPRPQRRQTISYMYNIDERKFSNQVKKISLNQNPQFKEQTSDVKSQIPIFAKKNLVTIREIDPDIETKIEASSDIHKSSIRTTTKNEKQIINQASSKMTERKFNFARSKSINNPPFTSLVFEEQNTNSINLNEKTAISSSQDDSMNQVIQVQDDYEVKESFFTTTL